MNFPRQFPERGFHRFAPRIDNDRPLWTQMLKMQTYRLADTPPDAVADHSLAEGARRREADARAGSFRFPDAESREQRSRKSRTGVIDSAEIRGSQQANTFRKTRDALPLGADGELVPPAGATPREHSPSVLGFHAGAESVRLCAPAVVRLKGTFRHLIPSYLV
jgi:hypothetical protein